MAIRPDINKLAESKAVHAAAGAGDLVAERIRKLRAELADEKTRQELTERTQQFIARGRQAVLDLRSEARTLPDKARTLANERAAMANRLYDELAERGQDVVARLRTRRTADERGGTVSVTVERADAPGRSGAEPGDRATAERAASAATTAAAAEESTRGGKGATTRTGQTRRRTTTTTTSTTAGPGSRKTGEAEGEKGQEA